MDFYVKVDVRRLMKKLSIGVALALGLNTKVGAWPIMGSFVRTLLCFAPSRFQLFALST